MKIRYLQGKRVHVADAPTPAGEAPLRKPHYDPNAAIRQKLAQDRLNQLVGGEAELAALRFSRQEAARVLYVKHRWKGGEYDPEKD